MGIISRLESRPQAMNSYQLQRLITDTFGGGATSSGVSVNSSTAMRLITVQNCIRVRAATMASLPLHVIEEDGQIKNKAKDFYLYNLLHYQPNSWMTAALFKAMIETYICLRGNFIAFKLGLPGRPIQELIPISWDKIHKIEQHEDFSITYDIAFKNGEVRSYPQDKFLHIRGLLTFDGITGVSPIEYARETIGVGLASDKFLGSYFGKGLHPSAVIKHPLPLNALAHANLKAALQEKYATLANTQDFMLIDEGMDITFPTIKLVDAQYLELMKMNESEICGLFRVPLMLIQSGDKTPTYASAEQFMINYSVTGVTPDCVNYEESFRKDLLTPEEKKKYYIKHDLKGLLRGDFKTRMEGYAIGIDKEIFNPNECRAWEELNPYPGGEIYKTRTSTTKDSGVQQQGGTV